ncbi:MAG: DUF2797 domain-containing protein [Candidatus Aenigmarchaeota archaeon]|nr:DUF2797 domain-containing protein [Candidatus Aenigmarchaeota archaeon]
MQITGYKWKSNGSWSPSLITYDNGKTEFHPLFDKYIKIKVGEKGCVGYFTGSKKTQCPNSKILVKGTICDSCKELDQYYKCIECTGICINEKNRDNCKESVFYMYFTTFNSLLKVGISQEHRFFERMIEQGAELGVKFSKIKDGKEVRIIEQKIKKLLICEDRVYGDIKERNIFGDPNNVIIKVKDALKTLKENNYTMINTEIYDFRKYYRLNKVKKEPRSVTIDTGTTVEGKVIAAKGNIIILEKDGEFYTANSHKLNSRNVIEFSIKGIEDAKIHNTY